MSLIENKSLIRAENEQFVRAVSVVSTQLNTKAQLGAVAQSFDPDAVDGDGDGMVQDGSPFERPAVIGAMTSAAQRIGQILSRAARLNKQSRAREYHRRYSGMSAKDIAIDAVPSNFGEWAALKYEQLKVIKPELPELSPNTTPQEMKEIVEQLESFVESDLLWMLSPEKAREFKELKKTDRAAAFRGLIDGAFDFSPQTVAKNRKLAEHVLTTNPQFRELVNKYGLPAIFGFGKDMDDSHFANGFLSHELGMGLSKFRNPKAKGRLDFATRRIGAWFMDGFMSPDVRSKKSKRWTVRSGSPESLLIHEYGHYLAGVFKLELSDLDERERTKKWQAWRFSVGAKWKETFNDIGSPEWYDKYKINRDNADVPQEIPHVETAYGESSPTEAFAESISAIFAHGGSDDSLVSDGMKELITDLLSLDPERDIREQLTPKRASREIIPDGFASRGAVVQINKEKDARYGDLTNPYELAEEVLGTLDGDDPVGKMVRRLQALRDDPESWQKIVSKNKTEEVDIPLNIRVANIEESELFTSVLLNDPAFAEMIRRHGIPNIYFSQTDLKLRGGHDVRGVLSGGFVPDTDNELNPPRIVLDFIGASHERNLPDSPMEPQGREKVRDYAKGRAPGNVTRTHLSRSDKHVVRHEGGHAIHDNLWEKQHRGEITGRRAQLIRAYSKKTWEEFYKEIGRPDLWREHQRALRATNNQSTMLDALRQLLPGSSEAPSSEIGQVDSAYAWFNPREMFAEAFSAYTSSNPAFRGLLNDTMIDHLQSMLGDADIDQVDFYGNPPPIAKEPKVDIPEPPRWDGFASTGKPIKSYDDLRRNWVDAISGNAKFTRREFFENTTTEQKVDLVVPSNEVDLALMAWDQQFEAMGLTWDQVNEIDLSDPFNPRIRDSGFDARVNFDEDTLDFLEYYGTLLKQNRADFSPEVVQANRDALRSALDAFPRFREVSERYGIPPITTMSAASQQLSDIASALYPMLQRFRAGEKLDPKFEDVMPAFMRYVDDGNWTHFIENPATKSLLSEWQPEYEVVGGYTFSTKTISLAKSLIDAYIDGTRIDHKFSPEPGNWLVGGDNIESSLLHEYGHYLNAINNSNNFFEKREISGEISKQFENVSAHIKTEYGRSDKEEYVAEIVAAVLSGSRDQEEMLSPEARQLARRIAGLPEKDPVFAGRIPGQRPTEAEVLADRFGELWRRTTDGLMEPFDKERGKRSRDGVPDVLETMTDAKLRTGLKEFPLVEFEHDGRTFSIREVGDTFEIEINGRTVARANVTPGKDGLPEINNVDVLPGYDGVAPDNDLYEMLVDHARKKYPSARAPRRARKTEVVSDGFASIGSEHYDMRQIDGTPGTPEYIQSFAGELEAAKASGKKVFFDYNGETREVEITEIFEKNGLLYMKGNDALRNGEERMFRLDRVSMPKRVENPETKADEVAKRPGRPPRKPVPVFTGKAAAIFEGAASWEEVAARLSKGRYVFFDFETTGIEDDGFGGMAHPGTPTQIGLIEIIDGKITRRWSTHVNPGRPLSIDPKTGRSWSADNLKYKDPATGELKNISDEWLSTQKSLKDALEEMLEFIGPIEDTILGGQNHPYDDDVMKRAMADAGIDMARWSPGGFIDSQALAQALLDKDSDDYPKNEKGAKTVSLGHLAKFMGYDMGEGWHSADADSEASYEAFKRLIDRAALQEGQGIPVRRDLLSPGGSIKEHNERLNDYERQKSGWDYKVKKYQEAQAAKLPGESADGFASRGSSRIVEAIKNRRRAKNPARWENLTQEQRDAATKASAEAAIEYLNALQDAGIDVAALRDLPREELDSILKDLVPGGEARVSDYVTGDGKALIEVSNATMGKVFMSLGLHVQVVSDDPNEQHLLENGINDMQKALQDYVAAVAKDPDSLLKDVIFMDWADKNRINLGSLNDPKKLEKAAKKFAEEFEINLCLYYKAGTNMLCGANIGIEREEMPQLGGRMKGDDTLAAKAIKSGLMAAKEFKIDKDKLNKLDKAKQDELINLAKDPAKVAELARANDPMVKELFDILNWNDTEANAEPIADRAAAALGITVDEPRFVDPATMLGAQNQLQGSKVENMADGAVKAVLEALPILEDRLGRKPTQDELMDYLANEIKHGLFQPTLTAGLPGSQTYMLDGHHRWSGLLMANKKLEAMGLDIRVQLNIKNYQTDIRSGLELGRAIQVAMGIKDAKLSGEDMFKFDPDVPELTEADFDKAIADLLDPANLIKRLREVREGGKFRETEASDALGGQASRLAPQKRPIQEVMARMNLPDPEPKSRVSGVKPQRKGYRAASTGSGWTSIEDHIDLELERGNELFETHQEYLDKGYEVAWVTHTPKEAGRYAISADQINAFDRGEISVDPADIDSVDLTGTELVGQDGEGGFLYARRKLSAADRQLRRIIDSEEEFVDGFASTGTKDRPLMIPLDLVSGVGDTSKRGGKAQRDQDVVPDDFYTRRPTVIAGVRVPEFKRDELGAPIPGAPIFRESMKIGLKTYTFEVDADGIVSVYTGRRYKMVAQMNLDRGHSHIGGRKSNKQRHHIDFVYVDKRHRRKGIATTMAEMAELAYGGQVEHSAALTAAGRKFRDADMIRRGTPGAEPVPLQEDLQETGFASRGPSGLTRAASRIAGRRVAKKPDQVIGEKYLDARLDDYDRFGGNPSNAELNMLAIYKSWRESDESWESFVDRFPQLQSLIQKEMSRFEQRAAEEILAEMAEVRSTPRPSLTTEQREGAIRRVNNPQIGAANLMAESVIDVQKQEKQKQDLQLQKNYREWKQSGTTWEKFVEDNPAIERLIENERSSGKLDERIFAAIDSEKASQTGLSSPKNSIPGLDPEITRQREEFERIIKEGVEKTKPARERMKPRKQPQDRLPQYRNAGFASSGDSALLRSILQPMTSDESSNDAYSLDDLADKLQLDELSVKPDETFDRLTGQIYGRLANGEATLAEKLGITPEQLRVRLQEIAAEINNFVDRFVNDKDVRKNIKLGYKILSLAAMVLGAKGLKEFLSTLNPATEGSGQGSEGQSLLDMVDIILSTGIHDALIAYGMNFANLIATEFSAMRLASQEKMKEMIADIRARIEGTGQKIGVMSNEMWNRLRGAWAKTRSKAPIGMPATVKQWIVAGSSAQWAEMSWLNYKSKTRITNDLLPTDAQHWAKIAVKVGQSPELIDIASYRSGIGYGIKRIKPRDVVRVYLTTG